ncbi:MAG: hypothetical protein IJ597_08175, partial [Synergistaceae bacterium]|nr:hypothetical protein [Synergistaceae bacterium]
MDAKKIFTAIFFLVLASSTANAKVTEQQALSDQRIAPYVEITKQQGAKFLPGRYANVQEILSRVNPSEKIFAASNLIVEIGNFNQENNAYPSNLDVYGENLKPCFMTFDASGAVPIIKTYAADTKGNYEIIAEDFAVVMPDDNEKYVWLFASTDTGEIRFLYPLNKFWFPHEWYEGEWICSDGSEIEFDDDGTVDIQDKKFGTYTVSDNRIAVKTLKGERDVIYCAYNPYNETLVMTFTSGPNGMRENAAVFVDDDDDDDKPKTKKAPAFKAPAPTTLPQSSTPTFPTTTPAPTMPQEFPKFPGAAQQINIEGVWQTYANGSQVV